MANVYMTNVKFGGEVNQSLYRAVAITQKQMASVTNQMARYQAQIQKANSLVNRLGGGFQRMGQIAGGVAIGDVIASGLERALGFAERLTERFGSFIEQSSKFAAKRELMAKGRAIC
jgi:hypothetical protein